MFYYNSDFVETKETKEKCKIVSVAYVFYMFTFIGQILFH